MPDSDINQEILETQLRLLAASHPDIVVTNAAGTGPRPEGEMFGHLHREGRLMLRRDAADDVDRFLRDRGHDVRPSSRAFKGPIDQHGSLPWHLDGVEPGRGVQEVVTTVREEFGADDDGHPAATPHHVFFLAPYGWLCPATEPRQVMAGTSASPAAGPHERGHGVGVAVLDTGLLAGAAQHVPWLAGITDADIDPQDLYDIEHMANHPDGFIDPYAAHGTFITGIIRRIAPSARMHVRRLSIDLRSEVTEPAFAADVVDELHIGDHLRAAVNAGHKVISLSAGGPTHNQHLPLAFVGMRSHFHRHDAVLIAAAGNGSTTDPFFPASLDWVVGVGALNVAGTGRASFSNHGPNADVYAPGENLVNAYASGAYQYFQPPETGKVEEFHGLAQWSGTSFAAPMVAGMVAARMSTNNETAPEAVAALMHLARTHHHVGGVGPTLDPAYGDLGL